MIFGAPRIKILGLQPAKKKGLLPWFYLEMQSPHSFFMSPHAPSIITPTFWHPATTSFPRFFDQHTRNPTNPLDAQSDNPQSAAKSAILLIRSIRKATIRNPQQCLRSFEEVIRFDHHHAPSTSLPPIKQQEVPSIIPSLKLTPSSNPPAVCLLSGQNRDSEPLSATHTQPNRDSETSCTHTTS